MIFLCLAIVWLAGFCLARFLFPASTRPSLHNVFLFSLGAGLGIAIASCIYFFCLALAGPKPVVMASTGAVAAVLAIALGITAKPRGNELLWAPGPPSPWYLTGLFLLAAAIAACMFVFYALNKPHGEWDAWSIWNLRARFLFRSGESWKDTFSNQVPWSHPDYPLLIPAAVALCWTIAGSESTAAPAGIAFLFTLSAAGLLISSIGILRGRTQALIAGILALGTASFVQIGGMQYADIPLCFFILATLSLFCLQDRYPGDLRFSAAAGLAAGFAAWTKNEGVLFVVTVLVARAIALRRSRQPVVVARHFLHVAAGLLLPLAVVSFFKLRYAPAGELFAQKPATLLAHIADIGRWLTAVEGFVIMLFVFGGFLLPIALALGLYWYLVRFHVEEQNRTALYTIYISLTLMLAGDFFNYVLFPSDVAAQINASLERAGMQLWPSGLLAFFLAANVPQLMAQPAETVTRAKPVKRAKAARRAAGQSSN
jgi:hypothetical protein